MYSRSDLATAIIVSIIVSVLLVVIGKCIFSKLTVNKHTINNRLRYSVFRNDRSTLSLRTNEEEDDVFEHALWVSAMHKVFLILNIHKRTFLLSLCLIETLFYFEEGMKHWKRFCVRLAEKYTLEIVKLAFSKRLSRFLRCGKCIPFFSVMQHYDR